MIFSPQRSIRMINELKSLAKFNKKYTLVLLKEFIKLNKRQTPYEDYTKPSMIQSSLKTKMNTIDSSANQNHQASKSTLLILTITLLFLINQQTIFFKPVLYLIHKIKTMVNLNLKRSTKTVKKTMIIFPAK